MIALLAAQRPVDFDRDVRPILVESCFACHGPDEAGRKAALRLDQPDVLLGEAVVVAGDPESSELWLRTTSRFDFDRMPPPGGGRRALDADELEVIRRWIEDGAQWTEHWAFVPPVRPEVPSDGGHPIDELIARRAVDGGLAVEGRAAPHQQLRRLAFDLTGLPPSPELAARFGSDPSDAAWMSIVDELLSTSAHAERMAMWWLDAARYADTEGFQADATLTNWPWRDWVVRAFEENMPFDEFTRRQFAGDLLEDATPDDVLATCFHRNHMHNGEGGRDPEESRVDYVRDRTNSVGTVWLGLTLECAQCHDHKFDPVSQADYYSLSAFFNSIDETGQAGSGARPYLGFTPADLGAGPGGSLALAERDLTVAVAELDRRRAASEPAFAAWLAELGAELDAGRRAWETLRPARLEAAYGTRLALAREGATDVISIGVEVEQDDFRVTFASPSLDRITGLELEVLHTADDGLGHAADGEFVLTGVELLVVDRMGGTERSVVLRSAVSLFNGQGRDRTHGQASGLVDDDPRTGWTTRGLDVGTSARVVLALEDPLRLTGDEELVVELQHRATVERALLRRFRLRATDRRGAAVRSADAMPVEQWRASRATGVAAPSEPLRERLREEFLEDDDDWRAASWRRQVLQQQLAELQLGAGEQRVMVLAERETPRATFVLERGVFDQRGAEVEPSLPAAIGEAEPVETRLTRLDLADWLTSTGQPLTPRVVANQMWQMTFGAGLVRTPDDFGLQGRRPVHGDVLDWLAVELVEHDWDLEHLLREIVLTETYRRSCRSTEASRATDPDNELLARGARFRLPSWMIRDAALAISGRLDRSMGGPPIRPPQPLGVWEDLFMGRFQYVPTIGATRHRRSLYAFWRRNVAPAFLFDHADRRNCDVGLRRTNTPLQALLMWNDETYRECATALAALALDAAPQGGAEQRIAWMGARTLGRDLEAAEIAVLASTLERARVRYLNDPGLARAAVAPSKQAVLPSPAVHDPIKHASLAAVAAVLLNLDEFMTHG